MLRPGTELAKEGLTIMSEPLPILLLLDLSTDNPLLDKEVLDQLPEPERSRARVVRATEHGATRSGRGSPAVWYPCADAIVKMVEHARGLANEADTKPKFYVAGRAGLPLFAELGCELSAWADATVLNQRKDGTWDVLNLRGPADPSAPPFFTISGMEGSDRRGRVSVVVATAPPRQEAQVRSFMSLQEEPEAGLVLACAYTETASGPRTTFLDQGNAGQAAHELEQLFGALPSKFPNATGLSLFVDGPASLALLAGRALNPKAQRGPVWVPNHDGTGGGGYYPALSLPYKIPPAGASARGTLIAILHAPEDATHLRKLLTVLEPQVKQGVLRLWHRDSVPPGTSIDEESRDHLERARLVLVLVSADLLASDDQMACMAPVARTEKATGVRLVPIVVRPCDIDSPPLSGRQCLPRSVAAISKATDADEVWIEVKREIQKFLDVT